MGHRKQRRAIHGTRKDDEQQAMQPVKRYIIAKYAAPRAHLQHTTPFVCNMPHDKQPKYWRAMNERNASLLEGARNTQCVILGGA